MQIRLSTLALWSIALLADFGETPAVAGGIPLSDLYGYSLVADWTISERETCPCAKSEYTSVKHFTERIYVSERGRLFHNRSAILNNVRRYRFSKIDENATQELIYQEGVGFVSRVIPSDYNQAKTTFARVATIAVEKRAGSLSCSVSTKIVLKSGQKDYIFYGIKSSEDKDVFQIHSFDMIQSSCTISKGNVFSQ
jgi:hypothetical protein